MELQPPIAVVDAAAADEEWVWRRSGHSVGGSACNVQSPLPAATAGSAEACIAHAPRPFDSGFEGSIEIDLDGINSPDCVIERAKVNSVA